LRRLRPVLVLLALTLVPLATFFFGVTQGSEPRQTLTTLSLVAIAASTLLVVAILMAGRLARGDRTLLLQIYGPLAFLTMLGLLVLVPLQGLLGLLIIFSPSSGSISVFLFPIMLPAMTLLTLGTVGVMRACLLLLTAGTIPEMAIPLRESEQPELWRFVRRLAEQVGTDPPDHIVAGLFPRFFVTEARVRTIKGKLRGRTMHISTSLARVLTMEELTAILGHELGHFKGQDTQFSRRFYPIYRAVGETASWLAESIHRLTGTIMLWPPYLLTMLFLDAFHSAIAEISRDREIAADREGANIAGLAAAGTALVKSHALDGAWEATERRMRQAMAYGQFTENLSITFSEVARGFARPQTLEGITDQQLPHPTDSHPPLYLRLEALGLTLDGIASEALQMRPDPAAISLIRDPETIEVELTDAFHHEDLKETALI
jgi:Zn-dependent protease with chaperone function